MERHLSTGVATIVALMTAHRVLAGRLDVATLQAEVTRISAELSDAGTSRPDPVPRREGVPRVPA